MKELRANSSPDIKIFLIGNKADLKEERAIQKEQGQKIKSDYNLDLFAETSAKTGFNTDELFARAAELLYTDYMKYKIGNPIIGKGKELQLNKNKINKKNNSCC